MKHRRWPYVVVIVLAVVGVLLFLAQDPQTLQVRSQYAATDPPFASYLASVVGAPLLEGDAVEVLENGDAIYPAMIAAIDAARTRVVFESYNFNLGKAGDLFTDALTRAAGRGVRVRVVLDAFGAAVPPLDMAKRFKAAGVDLVMFHPVGMWTVEATNYRTHRKLLVVDGAVAFTGGAGVADHWFGHAETRITGATRSSSSPVPVFERLKRVLRELARKRRRRRPNWTSRPTTTVAAVRHQSRRADDRRGSNANGGASSIKRSICILIAAARRYHRPSIVVRSCPTARRRCLRRGAQAQRLRSAFSRTETSPTPSGAPGEPARLPATSRSGRAHLRVPATMMHVEGDGSMASGSVFRIGELRQPIARAQRREHRVRARPGVGRGVDRVVRPRRVGLASTPKAGAGARGISGRARACGGCSARCSELVDPSHQRRMIGAEPIEPLAVRAPANGQPKQKMVKAPAGQKGRAGVVARAVGQHRRQRRIGRIGKAPPRVEVAAKYRVGCRFARRAIGRNRRGQRPGLSRARRRESSHSRLAPDQLARCTSMTQWPRAPDASRNRTVAIAMQR